MSPAHTNLEPAQQIDLMTYIICGQRHPLLHKEHSHSLCTKLSMRRPQDDRQSTQERTLRGGRLCRYFLFHSVCLTVVSPSFSLARRVGVVDMHWCLLCLHGFTMRSPGSWLGGSWVSACDSFALAPIGPSGDVFDFLLVVSNGWPARYLAHKLSANCRMVGQHRRMVST